MRSGAATHPGATPARGLAVRSPARSSAAAGALRALVRVERGAFTDIMSIPPSVGAAGLSRGHAGRTSTFFYVRRFTSHDAAVRTSSWPVTCRLTVAARRVPFALTDVAVPSRPDVTVLPSTGTRGRSSVRARDYVQRKWAAASGRWEVALPGGRATDRGPTCSPRDAAAEPAARSAASRRSSGSTCSSRQTGQVTAPGPRSVDRQPARRVDQQDVEVMLARMVERRGGDGNRLVVRSDGNHSAPACFVTVFNCSMAAGR